MTKEDIKVLMQVYDQYLFTDIVTEFDNRVKIVSTTNQGSSGTKCAWESTADNDCTMSYEELVDELIDFLKWNRDEVSDHPEYEDKALEKLYKIKGIENKQS